MPADGYITTRAQCLELDGPRIARVITSFLDSLNDAHDEPRESWVALSLYLYSDDDRDKILNTLPQDTREKLQKALSKIRPVPYSRLAVSEAALLFHANQPSVPTRESITTLEQFVGWDATQAVRAVTVFLDSLNDAHDEPREYWVALSIFLCPMAGRDKILHALPQDTRQNLQKALSEIRPVPVSWLVVAQAALLFHANRSLQNID